MKLNVFLNRLDKLSQVIRSRRLLQALIQHRVLAGAEHRNVLTRDLKMVVDIGANRGQFALAARRWSPQARVVSFEPLAGPADIFCREFEGDNQVVLHRTAIGPTSMKHQMHISARDDSSSLLPISSAQTAMFPGTGEVAITEVRVGPLNEFVVAEDVSAPAILKLDVQGFELDALRGCESLLHRFAWVYVECSFAELYEGQALAHEVIDWLHERGFVLSGVYNISYDREGKAVQADFLFERSSKAG